MSKIPPNLANLPPDVQAFVAAQAAELARKDAEMLGLSLSHANAQKRLKVCTGICTWAVTHMGLVRCIEHGNAKPYLLINNFYNKRSKIRWK